MDDRACSRRALGLITIRAPRAPFSEPCIEPCSEFGLTLRFDFLFGGVFKRASKSVLKKRVANYAIRTISNPIR